MYQNMYFHVRRRQYVGPKERLTPVYSPSECSEGGLAARAYGGCFATLVAVISVVISGLRGSFSH